MFQIHQNFLKILSKLPVTFHLRLRPHKNLEIAVLLSLSTVHLPVPRFYEEQEFYRTYFANEYLWLDVTYDAYEGVKSENGHWFIRFVRTYMGIHDENGFFQELTQTKDTNQSDIDIDDNIPI